MSKRLQAFFDNARTASFKYDGATITVREGLVIDRLDGAGYRRAVRDKWLADEDENKGRDGKPHLVIPDNWWDRIVNYVGFVTKTTKIVGKMPKGFKLPALDDGDALYEAFWVFLQLPVSLIDSWDKELTKVNAPESPPEVPPGDDKTTTNG